MVLLVGFEQLPGTWFNLTWNRGGVIFDKQLELQLGAGSVARETLKWWQSTFKEELADPNSNLRFIPACKAFNAGQHVYLGTLHHYYISLINDQAQSPIAGKGRVLGLPGDGKTIGYTMLYFLASATKNREWAWKLLQYLGGRTKNGEYTQAQRLAQDAMLASGYTPVMESELLRRAWAKWSSVLPSSTCSARRPTSPTWCPLSISRNCGGAGARINVELTACLSGKITADQACDNMTAALATAKRA